MALERLTAAIVTSQRFKVIVWHFKGMYKSRNVTVKVICSTATQWVKKKLVVDVKGTPALINSSNMFGTQASSCTF